MAPRPLSLAAAALLLSSSLSDDAQAAGSRGGGAQSVPAPAPTSQPAHGPRSGAALQKRPLGRGAIRRRRCCPLLLPLASLRLRGAARRPPAASIDHIERIGGGGKRVWCLARSPATNARPATAVAAVCGLPACLRLSAPPPIMVASSRRRALQTGVSGFAPAASNRAEARLRACCGTQCRAPSAQKGRAAVPRQPSWLQRRRRQRKRQERRAGSVEGRAAARGRRSAAAHAADGHRHPCLRSAARSVRCRARSAPALVALVAATSPAAVGRIAARISSAAVSPARPRRRRRTRRVVGTHADGSRRQKRALHGGDARLGAGADGRAARAQLPVLAADLLELLDDRRVPQRAERQHREAAVREADGEQVADHRQVRHLLAAGRHAHVAGALLAGRERQRRVRACGLAVPRAGHAARHVAAVHRRRPAARVARRSSLVPGLVDAREVCVVAAPLPDVPVGEDVPREVGHNERGGDEGAQQGPVVVEEATTTDAVLERVDHEAVDDDHEREGDPKGHLVTNLPGRSGHRRGDESDDQGRPTSRADEGRDADQEGADRHDHGATLRGVLGRVAHLLGCARQQRRGGGGLLGSVAAHTGVRAGARFLVRRRVRRVARDGRVDGVEHAVQLVVLVEEAVAALLGVHEDAVDEHIEVARRLGVRRLHHAHARVLALWELLADVLGRGFVPRPITSPSAVADPDRD
mmetsp:Transcript_6234/g.22155  ORF Transcript_6234/g.22155 Transcript_6234/m.22155 type:complete len:698 (+) Transcript_6234:126-2219(+)